MPRFPHVAHSVQGLSDQAFGRLVSRARNLEHPVFPLHIGDTYLPSLAAELCTRSPGAHRYAPVQGLPELLSAVQDKLERRSGLRVGAEQLQVMSGATSGLAVVYGALLNPGDEVLLPSPYWPLIRGLVTSRGAHAVEVPLFHRLGEPGFNPVSALRDAITERTVAIYLNTPHNPTGALLGRNLLEEILTLATEHDLWLISDEVYEDLFFGDEAPVQVFALPAAQERTIAVHSLSKAYGIAGARVGYCHGPDTAMPAVRALRTFFTYCAPTPMQHAAAHILRQDDSLLQQTRERYMGAAAMAADALAVPRPCAGTFLFFDTRTLRRDNEDTEAFLLRCLEAGVMLTPGAASGKHFTDWARLCFTVVSPTELAQALAQLQEVIRQR